MSSIAGCCLALTSIIYDRGGVLAQISGATILPVGPSGATPNGAGGFARLFIAAALIVALVAMILVARAYDLSRKREAQAVSLETRISRILRADPSLSSFPVVPTVRIPLWRGSPVIITMTGWVPQSEFRHAALELVLREAARKARTYRIEDGIVVDPAMAKRAA
jgi:hypothetical protein